MYSSLESIINDVAFKIVERGVLADKGEIDNFLGVLSGDGVYAMWVYAKSKGKDEKLMNELKPVLQRIVPDKFRDGNDYESFFKEIAEDLPTLLFVKDILERILTYARYHAKAMEGSR
ncbi:hypothetical protein SAMN05444406_11711 [Caldicoprobacter faecalis]|uniref:CRISPR type III-B/RAMP module-associated protein Cmr5 n=2 Tax=Caldicoprobacter faecalis TaxID=937334 RepID=A0A1I5WI94_9FIRM|nr:hypothetical protein SAMN05444406_11711 [Caldicoprobacter faecalis]